MNLFSKEKDFILKLTNLALTLWLLGSIIILYTSIIDVTYTEKPMSYKSYQEINCTNYIIEDKLDECQANYDIYVKDTNPNSYYKLRIILMSLGSVLIVSSSIYFLNREKKVK